MFTEVLQLQLNDVGILEVIGCENDYFSGTITNESICVWSGIIGREYGNVINYSDFSLTATYTITLTSSRGTAHVWKLENGVINGFKMPNWGGITDHVTTDLYPLLK